MKDGTGDNLSIVLTPAALRQLAGVLSFSRGEAFLIDGTVRSLLVRDGVIKATVTQAGEAQSGVRFVPGALMAGGGVPVESAGSIVAAVGVSGAPGGLAGGDVARGGLEGVTRVLRC